MDAPPALSVPTLRDAPAPAAIPWATALLVLLAVVAYGWSDAMRLLGFDRERVLAGEWWRLWTAHLQHFGIRHLFWNIVVVAPAGAWVERINPGRTRALYVFAPVIIGLALLGLEPRLHQYAGLSGLAVATLTLLAFTQLARPSRDDRWFWLSVLGLLAAKIGVELCSRQPAFVRFAESDVHPVPLAHLVGAACAIALHFVRLNRSREGT